MMAELRQANRRRWRAWLGLAVIAACFYMCALPGSLWLLHRFSFLVFTPWLILGLFYFWMIVALVLLWIMRGPVLRGSARRIWLAHNLCTECGYDLRGNDSGRCSECGFVTADGADGRGSE